MQTAHAEHKTLSTEAMDTDKGQKLSHHILDLVPELGDRDKALAQQSFPSTITETSIMKQKQKDQLLLYNILLLINLYIGSIAISAMTKTMKNIGISHGYFIRSLGHCISP